MDRRYRAARLRRVGQKARHQKLPRPNRPLIFSRYLELKSLGKLVDDLDARAIVTKRRNTKVTKYNGKYHLPTVPSPISSKTGSTRRDRPRGKWFPGEHEAIVDRQTFDRVQQLLATNSAGRNATRSDSEALLAGKLFDDKGNRMSPSYSSKERRPLPVLCQLCDPARAEDRGRIRGSGRCPRDSARRSRRARTASGTAGR